MRVLSHFCGASDVANYIAQLFCDCLMFT